MNYWEPWYLGFDAKVQRARASIGHEPPYRPLQGADRFRSRPGRSARIDGSHTVLVSGGVQDPPRNWLALNHLVAVNNVLGQKDRAFLTARAHPRTHRGRVGAGACFP